MCIFTFFKFFISLCAVCSTLIPSKTVISFLSIYTPILFSDCLKITSIGLFLPFLHFVFVKIHKISIFGKISLDFLCYVCYNTNTSITKVLQRHNADETTNFNLLFCVVPCKLWLIVYQTHNHRAHSNLLWIFRSRCDQQLWKIIFGSGVASIRPKTLATLWNFVLKFGNFLSTNLF